MDVERFAGKIAVITGSTQGLGETLAHRLVDEGLAGVVITGRDAARGEAVQAALAAKGCAAVFVPADLADAEQVAGIVSVADERFGVVHHLANCAGITDRGSVWDTTPELFDKMMAVNLRAPFQLIQGVARMARREGVPASVVNVGSTSGYGGQPFLTPYSVSKGALMTLTKNLAYQLMRDRIRVISVNPGWMNTPGEHDIQRRYHGAGDDWLALAEATRPFGRLISMDELTTVLAFVLSDDAGLMTGAVIDYDQTVQGGGDPPTPPPLS
jgi:NAD(P)-dependent dehydrogenase (short-subunit alcohol dehydrogenase family)